MIFSNIIINYSQLFCQYLIKNNFFFDEIQRPILIPMVLSLFFIIESIFFNNDLLSQIRLVFLIVLITRIGHICLRTSSLNLSLKLSLQREEVKQTVSLQTETTVLIMNCLGKFICRRNLDSSGSKKGKGRKCSFKCDDGWRMKAKKGHKGEAKPAKDGILKCSKKTGGWKAKPKSLVCIR